jgi:hypothetical protein
LNIRIESLENVCTGLEASTSEMILSFNIKTPNMSKYLKITNDIIDLRESFSIDLVFVEITNHGKVLREIGVDSSGKIIHKYPSHTHQYGHRGIFDLNIFDFESFENEMDEEEFEILWNKESNSQIYNRLYPKVVNSHRLKDTLKQILVKEICSINDIDLGDLTSPMTKNFH